MTVPSDSFEQLAEQVFRGDLAGAEATLELMKFDGLGGAVLRAKKRARPEIYATDVEDPNPLTLPRDEPGAYLNDFRPKRGAKR